MNTNPNSMLSVQFANDQLKKDIRALKAEIGRLQTKNAKLEADKSSAIARIKALEKLKVMPRRKPESDIEAVRKLVYALRMHGFVINELPPKK